MPNFNDLKLDKWKESEIWTDSLWLISERDKSGKHSGFYHGNFVPQVPRQLILRYTKKNEIVFDPFLGSGTTAYEAERLKRHFIGIDIQKNLVNYVKNRLSYLYNFAHIVHGDSMDSKNFKKILDILKKHKKKKVDLAILHPPYFNIVKFSSHKKDLSNSNSLQVFLENFRKVLSNTISILEPGRYLAVVIGDYYSKGSWIPLSFYCLQEAERLSLNLKSIVVKNMEGNRAKQNKEAIWRYRALTSDYYIFKHEYILIFKK